MGTQFRALITGASGWIGFNLCNLWLSKYGPYSAIAMTGPVQHETERQRLNALRDWPVNAVPLELRHRPVFSEPIEDFDVLFHLAAYVRTEDDADEVRINDTGTRRLLEQLGDRLRNKHVVFTSSVSAVDSTLAVDGWMNESTECSPRTEYGRSKLNAEEIIRMYSVRFGFTYTILRLPIVYGPGYRPQGIFGFYREQLPRKTLGGRLVWPGKISLVEVGDAASILEQAAVREDMRGKTFFVSSAEDPRMSEMAQVSTDCLHVEHKPLYLSKKLFELMNTAGKWLARTSFLPHSLKILGWRVSLVIDGYRCDGSELTSLLDMQYVPWKDAFRRMYELPPATPSHSPEMQLAGTLHDMH